MASIESVLIAALVHIIFRYAVFLTPQYKLQTPGPLLPSFIVCIAISDVIYDNRIFPIRFQNMSPGGKFLFETATAILLLEVGMLFWQSIEHSVYLIVRYTLLDVYKMKRKTYYANETLIIGAFTLPLSLVILAMIEKVTDRYQMMRERLHI